MTAISIKHRIAEVTQKMLDSSLPYLVGAITLESLRHEVGAYENDPDFMPFVAILSEINSLPFDAMNLPWSDEDKAIYKEEIDASTVWAKEFSLSHCESLHRRYAN